MDCGLRTPKVVVILVKEGRHQAVAHRHIDQGQSAIGFGQRPSLLLCDLLGSLIEHLSWRSRGIEESDVCAILRPLCAVGAADCHYLVVGLRVFVAGQPRRRPEQKVASAGNPEWSYVLPMKTGSLRDSVDNWTTDCGLPVSSDCRAGDLEERRETDIPCADGVHGPSCGVAFPDAVQFRFAIRDLCQRGWVCSEEGGRPFFAIIPYPPLRHFLPR